jgi:PAS domain S-box-containing protein
MEDTNQSRSELLAEIQALRERLSLSEETLRAIQHGEVDALVISTPQGEKIFTLQSADQSYRLLVEQMQQGAIILSSEGLILYCNQSFANLLQHPLERLIGSNFNHFISYQDVFLFQTLVQQAAQGERNSVELFLLNYQQVEIPVYLSIHELNLGESSIYCIVVTDLTQQKFYEKTLVAERLARLILEQAGEAILVCNHTGQIIRASQIASQLWGEPLLFQAFDRRCSLYLSHSVSTVNLEVPGQKASFSIVPVLQGASYQGLEVEFERPNGNICYLVLNARPLTDKDNHFRGAIIILTEITQQKQAEIALRENQRQLQQQLAEIEAIYQSAPIGLNVLDTDLRFVRINQRLAEINGLPVEAHIGRTIREVLPDLADKSEQLLHPILETGEPLMNVEINGETPAQPGVQRSWLEHFLPLKDGDQIIGISTVCEEITERKRTEAERQQTQEELKKAKEELEIRVAERTAELHQMIAELQQAEERIKASLREKEVLLKEIHHRVKNNLGIVSSLLQMQIRRTDDPQTNIVLQDNQNRIASIALVHEKLYRSEDLANINFTQYIRDLTVYLFDSYNINSNQIKLNVQVENASLDIETTIPCGLIINELVSNALKYAFPDNRQGEIQVKFFQSQKMSEAVQQCISTLIVKDNGIGLPADFEIKNAKTLGLKLVQGLVKQIGATLEINSRQGTEFQIKFVKSGI